MDITTKSVIELKALAFDLLVQLENVQNNLKVVNAEIEKKVKSEEVEKEKVSPVTSEKVVKK
jgi:hypothetical protein